MFEISNLRVHFGVIEAVKGISLEVMDGEIVTLIGANGAGKTTTLRTASGLKKPTSGSILLDGKDITDTTAIERVRMGISQVPEGRRVFSTMTTLENLELGAYQRRDKAGISKDLKKVYEHFPILFDRKKQMAGTLSGGEQQMLSIGRALMSRPRLLFLDEPSMGLAPILVQEIFNIIENINKTGTTILLVEQNASLALKLANRAYVMETGSIVLSGTGSELMQSEEIKKAYLGG